MSNRPQTSLFDIMEPEWSDIYFPVERTPIVAFPGGNRPGIPAERFEALVDSERGTILGIVTRDYKLLTNEQAVEMGKRVFEQILGPTIAADLSLFNVVQPKGRTFCHIDLTVKGTEFELFESDIYMPFLRVTNSYNKTRPLSFHLGFCRGICKNGMIFGAIGINFKAYHTAKEIAVLEVMDFDDKKLSVIQAQFIERTRNLKRFAVPPDVMLPLVCKVFNFQFTDKAIQSKNTARRAKDISEHVALLTGHYFGELGHNAYAALNVLTDFAARPVGQSFGPSTRVHQLQSECMRWIDEFIREIQQDSFVFDKYLGEFRAVAKLMVGTEEPK